MLCNFSSDCYCYISHIAFARTDREGYSCFTNIYAQMDKVFLRRYKIFTQLSSVSRFQIQRPTCFSTKPSVDDENDEPLKYTASKAANWKAKSSNSGSLNDNDPEIQPLVIVGSLAVFMLYFFILREENDLDKALYNPLFEQRPDIEIATLEGVISECKARNVDTSAMEAKLEQLKAKLSN